MDLSIDCCNASCEYYNKDFKNNCEQNQTDFLKRCADYIPEPPKMVENLWPENSYSLLEHQIKKENEGPKEKEGKIHWKYFPFEECEEVVKAFEYGVKKYGRPFTYRKGIDPLDLMEAAMRHLIEIQKGNILDSESGLNHFAHVAASALMALSQYIKLDYHQYCQKKEEP